MFVSKNLLDEEIGSIMKMKQIIHISLTAGLLLAYAPQIQATSITKCADDSDGNVGHHQSISSHSDSSLGSNARAANINATGFGSDRSLSRIDNGNAFGQSTHQSSPFRIHPGSDSGLNPSDFRVTHRSSDHNSSVQCEENNGTGHSVPEPTSLLLLGAGFAGLVALRRRVKG